MELSGLCGCFPGLKAEPQTRGRRKLLGSPGTPAATSLCYGRAAGRRAARGSVPASFQELRGSGAWSQKEPSRERPGGEGRGREEAADAGGEPGCAPGPGAGGTAPGRLLLLRVTQASDSAGPWCGGRQRPRKLQGRRERGARTPGRGGTAPTAPRALGGSPLVPPAALFPSPRAAGWHGVSAGLGLGRAASGHGGDRGSAALWAAVRGQRRRRRGRSPR